MKILITGFEEFGGMPVNPSRSVVDHIKRLNFKANFEVEIVTNILPVNFEESGIIIQEMLKESEPDLAIFLGVDLDKKNIELEIAAHKNEEYIGDSFQIIKDVVTDELPDNYFTKIDAQQVCDELVAKGHRIIVSDDTGMYVCNHVYYAANILIEHNSLNTKCLFIHVPYPYPYSIGEERVVPDFDMETIQNTIFQVLIKLMYQNLEALS